MYSLFVYATYIIADSSEYSFEVVEKNDEVSYIYNPRRSIPCLKRFSKSSINRDEYISDKDIR